MVRKKPVVKSSASDLESFFLQMKSERQAADHGKLVDPAPDPHS
jgi:hypothetical protein